MKNQSLCLPKITLLMTLMLSISSVTAAAATPPDIATASEEKSGNSSSQPADRTPQSPHYENTPERQAMLQKLHETRAARIEVAKRIKDEEARLSILQKISEYQTAIKLTVGKNWKIANKTQPFKCEIVFTQIPGGLVVSVEYLNCPDNKEERHFIERSLMKEPMPYSGFESVFKRKIHLVLCSPEPTCH